LHPSNRKHPSSRNDALLPRESVPKSPFAAAVERPRSLESIQYGISVGTCRPTPPPSPLVGKLSGLEFPQKPVNRRYREPAYCHTYRQPDRPPIFENAA